MTETEKKQNKGAWAMTIVSAIVLLGLTIFLPEGFWLGLPTFFGGLVMAMDWV